MENNQISQLFFTKYQDIDIAFVGLTIDAVTTYISIQ